MCFLACGCVVTSPILALLAFLSYLMAYSSGLTSKQLWYAAEDAARNAASLLAQG